MFNRLSVIYLACLLFSIPAIAQPIKCGGDSISKKFLLAEIENHQAGQVVDFRTHYLVGTLRPPESFASPIHILNEDSESYQKAVELYAESESHIEKAIAMADGDPEHMKRYRKNCLFDETSDADVLRRGVEVMVIYAHFANGGSFKSSYMTSYKPASIQLDDGVLLAFKNTVEQQAKQQNTKISFYEIYHNHVLPDTLSLTDVNFAAAFSMEFGQKTQVIALVDYDGKISEVRSPVFMDGGAIYSSASVKR